MGWRLADGILVEQVDDELVLLVSDRREVHRATDDAAEVIARLLAGETALPRRLDDAAHVLAGLGIVADTDGRALSRRRLFAAGATGAVAVGLHALVLPTAAHAVSGSPTTSSTTTTTLPAGFGTQWTARSTPTDETFQWSSVAYGNGRYVAVSSSGISKRAMSSTDGINWTSHSTPVNTVSWQDVTYGNGVYVAVANLLSAAVMTSPDGETWTQRTCPNTEWFGVTHGTPLGTSRFVAVGVTGTGNRVMTSDDNGATWTAGTSAADQAWTKVTYGNSLYVAVSNTTPASPNDAAPNRSMVSSDGLSWTSHLTGLDLRWNDVAYGEPNGNPLFVAVARTSGTGSIMTSPDGETWTQQTTPITMSPRSVTWGGGRFVVVGQSMAVVTSPNGVDWTQQTTPSLGNTLQGVAYGPAQFVAVSLTGSGNQVITSP